MARSSRSITINYSGTTGIPRDVTLELIDYCLSTPIAVASVAVTGPNGYNYTGNPDGFGRLALGVLQPGHYDMLITATGYVSSADDLLINDGFDV